MSDLPPEVLRCQVDSLRDALEKVLFTDKQEEQAWFVWHNAREKHPDRCAIEERQHLAAITAYINAKNEARLLLTTMTPPQRVQPK